MFDILLTTEIMISALYLISISIQYFRKRINFKKSRVELIKIKTYDSDAYMISFLLIYIVYSSWSQFIKLGNTINYLVFCFLISTIAIIRIIELFKPLRIRENGIYSGNRYINWSDMLGYRWEVVHTDKIEKLIIQSNKKTLFPLLKEFDLKVNIPIKSKKLIEDIISENINASEQSN